MKAKTLLLVITTILTLNSCLKTEIINMAPVVEKIIEKEKSKPRKDSIEVKTNVDTTEINDTSRVPIDFNVSVDDWQEENIKN